MKGGTVDNFSRAHPNDGLQYRLLSGPSEVTQTPDAFQASPGSENQTIFPFR